MESAKPIWRVRPKHPTRELSWRYVHELPKHDCLNAAVEIDGVFVKVHMDAEFEPVTAAVVAQALEDAHEAGWADGRFGAIKGPQRRKNKRSLNQHRARRRQNFKRGRA